MKTFLFGLLVFVAAMASQSAPLHFQSHAQRVSLLELYTSEGCSSCPPAEAWLAQQKESPKLWQDFVPVAFHVDYWNYLGWVDRWSDASYSLRQNHYAEAWQSQNVYTPCFVLNGQEWRLSFFHRSIPEPSGPDVGVLSVTSADTNHWEVTFAPAEKLSGTYEIHAALLAGNLSSDVQRGENAGRTLQHEFVALDLVQIGLRNEPDGLKGKFILDSARHAEKTQALAVWLTQAGGLAPVQATGGWIK